MKKIVVLLTACLLLLGMAISASAQITPKANTVDYDDLNFSVQLNKASSIQMGDVLDQIPNVSVSAQERNYIRYHFEKQSVLYYTKPTVMGLQSEYDGETRQLTVVMMDDYQVLTNQNTDVVWVPWQVSVGNSVAEFVPAPDIGANYYRAVLKEVAWSANATLTVEYASDFTISAETLNDFINFAYEKALELDKEHVVFEAELAVYQEKKQAYDAYRQELDAYNNEYDKYELYLNSVALYEDYLLYKAFLEKLDEYNTAHDAYLANVAEWTAYENELAKYREYVNYKNNQYPGLYQSYENDLAKARHQLYLLSLLKVKDPNTGISFVDMMVDDRIGEMIEIKKTQVELAVGEGTTKNVIDSTRALQAFCKEYQSLSNEQEIYAFYLREYASFVKNLNLLYDNIQKLYKNDTIYRVLQKEYPDHITGMIRMLGSLYVQKCLFDDTVRLNMNTVVDSRGNQNASALVHASLLPESDTNKAAPLKSWPTAPTDPETFEVKVQPVEPSVKLQDAVYPTMPQFSYVTDAQEIPSYMEKPGTMNEPIAPAEVAHPGPAPVLDWAQTEFDAYDAYKQGLIVQREVLTQAQTVTLTTSAKKSISLGADQNYFFVYFYNTDDQGTYLGHSLGVEYGETAVVPEELQSATKPAEIAVAYEFAGWVDQDGKPLDLSCMTGDVNAYASYVTVPRKYTVTWQAGDETTVEQWEYGQTPVFTGTTDKSPSAQYTYTFIGWDKQFSPVTGDVTYTALYDHTERRYQVTFDMMDGTTVTNEFVYGWNLSEMVATLKKPYRAPDAQYTYTFAGWKDAQGNLYTDAAQFPQLTGQMHFTAHFDQTLNYYTVTWVVDGQISQTLAPYGQIPVFGDAPEQAPFKQSDERYHYAFEGWDTDLVPVTGEATYVAQFAASIRYYRVDFVVEGQTYSYELEYEQLPVFEGTPEKASDVQYDYTFIGWDTEPVPVREDVIYVAEFGKVLRKYPVKFVVGGNEFTSEFDYGTIPVFPNSVPTKSDDAEYRYEFSGWDKELAAVDGSAVTYTACFDAIALAPSQDGENGKLSFDAESGKLELLLGGTQADLSLVFDKAGKEHAALLEVKFGQAVLTFSKEQIDAFYLMGNGIGSVMLAPVEHEGRVSYQLELLDADGNPIPYLVSELSLKLPYDGVYSADVYRVNADGTQTKLQVQHVDGYLVFSTMDMGSFAVVDKYLIEKIPAENGVIDVITEAYEGDVVTVSPNPDEGYHVESLLLEYDGQQIRIEPEDGKYTFVMPRGNVKITPVFKVVEGGTVVEVIVGVVTALLIVAIGLVIVVVLRRRKTVKV